MVVLNVKKQEKTLFLWQCSVNDSVDEVIKALVNVQNERLYLERLISGTFYYIDAVNINNINIWCDMLWNLECEELVKYGPAKEVPGLTEEEMLLSKQDENTDSKNVDSSNNSSTTAQLIHDKDGVSVVGIKALDPTGRRIGIAPISEKGEILKTAISKAQNFLASRVVLNIFSFQV